MASHTFWLVPHRQHACVSGLLEIAEKFWEQGYCPFLELSEHWGGSKPAKEPVLLYDHFMRREQAWNASGRPTPPPVSGPFDSTWIACRPYKFLIPSFAPNLEFHCPRCQQPIRPRVRSTANEYFGVTYGAFVACSACGSSFPATELSTDLSKTTWAQFCVNFEDYVFDEPMDGWVRKVESIVGPCAQFVSWHE